MRARRQRSCNNDNGHLTCTDFTTSSQSKKLGQIRSRNKPLSSCSIRGGEHGCWRSQRVMFAAVLCCSHVVASNAVRNQAAFVGRLPVAGQYRRADYQLKSTTLRNTVGRPYCSNSAVNTGSSSLSMVLSERITPGGGNAEIRTRKFSRAVQVNYENPETTLRILNATGFGASTSSWTKIWNGSAAAVSNAKDLNGNSSVEKAKSMVQKHPWGHKHSDTTMAKTTQRRDYLDGSVIENLLSNDEGEEDMFMSDDSQEAAQQVADGATTSMMMSEVAKQKASQAIQKPINIAVESSSFITPENDEDTFISSSGESLLSVDKNNQAILARRTKVRAKVKETGKDTLSSYLKSMGNHDLLKAEDEIVLGRQIQVMVRWEQSRKKLEEDLNRAPTYAEWAEALDQTVPSLKRQLRRSQRAKAAMVEANLRLVVSVARQTVRTKTRGGHDRKVNFVDVCQDGIIGLAKACERFDPEKGFRFSTYANWFIKQEVQNSVRSQGRTIRLPPTAMRRINEIRIAELSLKDELGHKPTEAEIAAHLDISAEKVRFYLERAEDAFSIDRQMQTRTGKGSGAAGRAENGDLTLKNFLRDPENTPAEDAEKQMLRLDVRRLIKTLSPREQAVIRLRFGLDDGEPRTLDYIAQQFKVPVERIRKIEAKALLKLRQPYRNQSVQCYVSDFT